MRISDICVRRPVFATVMSLILILLGVVSYDRLTVREYPNIDEPVVSVATAYIGASAEIIETQVTQVLEGSIAGIEGIDVLSSVSRPESSRITVRFRQNIDPDVAASDVRDRVGRVRGRLPDEIDEPIIAKVEADAQPIIVMPFTSDRLSSLEITDFIDRYVVDRFKNLPGVADVQILGERRYAMRLWIDRARLASYNLTVQDVETALRGQNIEVPAGPGREQRPRIHRALPHRAGRAGAVRQHRGQDGRWLSGQGARCRDRRTGRRRRAPGQPVQRPELHRHRHHQAGDRQSAGRLRCGPANAAPRA